MIKKEKLTNPGGTVQRKPLRLWPGVIIVILQWFVRYLLPEFVPDPMVMMYAVLAAFLLGVMVFIWWAFFSRAPGIERWLAIVLVIAAMLGSSFLLDESIATANMGLMYPIYSFPVICLIFVVWAIMTRNLSNRIRRLTMIIAILLSAGIWVFLRTDGMNGDGKHDLNWRWAKSQEERLLDQPAVGSTAHWQGTKISMGAGWPGFRGPNRNGIIHGLKISTNWSASPPLELWRRPVGPGCSSCAIRGNLFYTQEQRGEYEMVSCYDLITGEPVWQHHDSVRFYDSHAGAGPRSTPSLAGNCVYTMGATGLLNALDALDGKLRWSRNASSDANVKVLTWGFTSSPLVVGNMVIVALSGKLVAYDTTTGNPQWFGSDGGPSYSSPQLFKIGGIPQVILMNTNGAISVDPANGKKQWEYSWPVEGRILQPALIGNNDLLLSGEMKEVRRITVSMENGGYKISEHWTSPFMVHFNDHVIHEDYAYVYDGPNLTCIDLSSGIRKWKHNHYRGFIILMADQDLLLVLLEKGDLALVSATPDKFTELARIPAIKGKTWNHPALAGDILVVRNAQEMAAFRLPNSQINGFPASAGTETITGIE